MIITCDIQPIGIVTMAMKVLYNSYNMCIHDLPSIYSLIPVLQLLHVITFVFSTYVYLI